MTSPLPLVNVNQPKQGKSWSFFVNIQNLTLLKLGEGTFYTVRNRVKAARYKLINDEYYLVS